MALTAAVTLVTLMPLVTRVPAMTLMALMALMAAVTLVPLMPLVTRVPAMPLVTLVTRVPLMPLVTRVPLMPLVTRVTLVLAPRLAQRPVGVDPSAPWRGQRQQAPARRHLAPQLPDRLGERIRKRVGHHEDRRPRRRRRRRRSERAEIVAPQRPRALVGHDGGGARAVHRAPAQTKVMTTAARPRARRRGCPAPAR